MLDPESSYVGVLRRNYLALDKHLEATDADAAIRVDSQGVYAKAMVLAAGNCFERKTCEALLTCVAAHTNDDARIVNLFRVRLVERQFHTLFDWKTGKMNSFLALFGDDFKEACLTALVSNDSLQEGARDFMTLVTERNLLAHDQKIEASPQFTTEEVFAKFCSAAAWLAWLENRLLEPATSGE